MFEAKSKTFKKIIAISEKKENSLIEKNNKYSWNFYKLILDQQICEAFMNKMRVKWELMIFFSNFNDIFRSTD